MSDFLLQLGQNQSARKLIKGLGLPIPMPQALARAAGPYEERPLADQPVVVGGAGALGEVIAETLARAGANPFVLGDDSLVHAFDAPGQAYGRPSKVLEPTDLPQGFQVHGLVFDATGVAAPADLRGLYDLFHPLVKSLARCGRAVVLARPASAAGSPAEAAARAAIEGFTRSLAKEIGKRGATAQLVVVDEGSEDRLEPVLRFLLSRRSAFVTGQVLHVSARAKAADGAPPRTRPLENRTVLVTGAARGIGAATARLLADEGARVLCLDRPADDAPLSQIAREIGGQVVLCDITAADAAEVIAREAGERGIDVVVHNAGITRDKTLARMDAERWDQTLEVNLDAVVRVTDALLARGTLRDGGRIVCLSSIAGLAGNLGQTNYAASKAGIVGLVEKLAGDLAGRGITVNAIAPGFIETRLTAAIPVMIREVARRLSAVGQGGLPRDVGDAITFLATPGAQGLTGGVLRVCGGAFVGR